MCCGRKDFPTASHDHSIDDDLFRGAGALQAQRNPCDRSELHTKIRATLSAPAFLAYVAASNIIVVREMENYLSAIQYFIDGLF